MHNVWILLKREYLERVRSRSFIVFTLLMPAFMAGSVLIPAKIAEMTSGGKVNIVIVANDAGLATAVGHELSVAKQESELGTDAANLPQRIYTIEVDTDTSDAERDHLTQQLGGGKITGFLWMTNDALANHNVQYSTKEAGDFDRPRELRNAIRTAVTKQRLAQNGMSEADVESLLRPIVVKTVRPEKGHKGASSTAIFITAFAMVVLLYAVVMIYGMAVMRSVIEEKSTRILEVLLSSVTSKELLAGKILGVGAVGLTQILVWVICASVISAPGFLVSRSEVHLPMLGMLAFAIFFLLGYLLYSSMYAAIGSMVNTEQEAQQMQWPAMFPIILAVFLMNAVIQHPNSPLSFWLSMVPFFAPILMLVRILIETPPLWQIGLCIALMVVTIYALVNIASRIYRVGILMYGKRPTLPELRRWLKYAG
jgi:ABC-2 type transport system permease protein